MKVLHAAIRQFETARLSTVLHMVKGNSERIADYIVIHRAVHELEF